MSETNGNGTNGNGNGKTTMQIGSAVGSWFAGFIPPLLASLVSFVFLWSNLSGGIHKEIEDVKSELNKSVERIEKTFEERAGMIGSNRQDIVRLQEAKIENEVQHAYRGVNSNMEAVISEMRDHYRSECPSAPAYKRDYYPPQRLGKDLDE